MNNFIDLTDDLSADQLRDMLHHFWANRWPVTRASVKAWRRLQGLVVKQ